MRFRQLLSCCARVLPAVLVFAVLAAVPALAESLGDQDKVISEGMKLQDVQLPPALDADARYLGVPAGEPFALSDIKTDYLLLQVFSMYCPHCQREAPLMKELFDKIKASGKADTLKIIGLGVGNSDYEVGFFKDQYALDFPLFPDPDYRAYDYVGVVGTPFYVLVKLSKNGGHQVLFTQEGTFEDVTAFYSLLLEKSDLK
ncbi:peroxiredoxin family protein [Oceanidesulfovibrio marinus]|uniref:TlpA family protein disulfide reductase n=1 Tax=Oceanidesulfovibrio marinus TaxID=370038 RepID=A0A6P1ZEX2_9BACT|nr:TlpA disulfide reductase family protein [Oceanidesulfovibrio marinus]QJT09384.1 TlpA family protein disulfide reductase [Oceanidesulfovibrio marinus]TVM32877.1 TlpA family protein disulfide reductase [Oceanidesulfovibrio marinus]